MLSRRSALSSISIARLRHAVFCRFAEVRAAACEQLKKRSTYAYVPVLLGLGFHDLSMNPVAIPAAKRAVSLVNVARAREVVRQALGLASAKDIAALVDGELMPEMGWTGNGRFEG